MNIGLSLAATPPQIDVMPAPVGAPAPTNDIFMQVLSQQEERMKVASSAVDSLLASNADSPMSARHTAMAQAYMNCFSETVTLISHACQSATRALETLTQRN